MGTFFILAYDANGLIRVIVARGVGSGIRRVCGCATSNPPVSYVRYTISAISGGSYRRTSRLCTEPRQGERERQEEERERKRGRKVRVRCAQMDTCPRTCTRRRVKSYGRDGPVENNGINIRARARARGSDRRRWCFRGLCRVTQVKARVRLPTWRSVFAAGKLCTHIYNTHTYTCTDARGQHTAVKPLHQFYHVRTRDGDIVDSSSVVEGPEGGGRGRLDFHR